MAAAWRRLARGRRPRHKDLTLGIAAMPPGVLHFIVTLSPRPDGIEALRQELSRVAQASAAEPGCRSFVVLEAVRPSVTFVIHSSWQDEAAFDHHGRLDHTVQFLDAASALVTHAIRGWRLREAVGITYHADDHETARQAR